jgi:hypothetical protein
MNRITIAHIINPFTLKENSDFLKVQSITFETMKAAREAAEKEVKVEFFAAVYPEDEAVVPAGFIKTRPLDRSILDVLTITPGKPRKLPLLKDILDRLYEQSSADYFIYTNIDIALMPGFYMKVSKIIAEGYDGFVINRRTISKTHTEIKEIPLMIEEAGKSEKHPGFDCFIFKREAYKHYRLGTACVGANWIGRVLISNVMSFAGKFKVFDDLYLTFHLGDDRPWMHPANDPYNLHNEDQLCTILDYLTALKKVRCKKELQLFYSDIRAAPKNLPGIPPDIVAMNSPVVQLPDKPENIYHSELRYSTSWENCEKQLLRQDPIFVVGYPRSGTTLVQALIATQENIYSFHETHFFGNVRWKIVVNDKGDISPQCMDNVIRMIRERLAFSKNAEEHVRSLAQNGSLSTKMLFEIIVIDNLIAKVDHLDLARVRWLEKTPQHELYLEVIHRFYPAVKVIQVMRHPEKAILSRRKHFTFDSEADWSIERHARNWLECVNAVEKFKETQPGSVMTVRLENLTRDTQEEMRKICKFLEIPFDAARLKNYKEIAKTLYYPWETWKRRAGEDIFPAAAVRGDNRLSAADREILLEMAGKKLKKYGYLPVPPVPLRKGLTGIAVRTAKKSLRRVKRLLRRALGSTPPLMDGGGRPLEENRKEKKGKINMVDQLSLFYGQHRSGWIYAVQHLTKLHNPEGVRFDAFIERTFAWRPHETKPHQEPWIGFIHVPPNIPDWFKGDQSNETIFKSDAWKKSVPYCRGLYTLSQYHLKYLENILDIPVNNVIHPVETPDLKWRWERFEANKEKKLVQVGWWLRRIHSIFQLPAGEYKKIFLKVSYFNWDDLIQKEREILIKENLFRDEMYDTAETLTYLPDPEYDRMLAENIVFIHLYDSSANNTIIECIVRNTPILVNPLEPVVEYLGKDYPFYFNSLEEAAQKAANYDLVLKTHRYLVNHPIKEKLTGDYFFKSFIESEIYQKLEVVKVRKSE